MLYFKVAQTFVKDLQEENKAFLTREKEMVNQLERLQDQKRSQERPVRYTETGLQLRTELFIILDISIKRLKFENQLY